jgi:hypothetical protein
MTAKIVPRIPVAGGNWMGSGMNEPRGTAGLAVLEARSQKHWANWLQRKSLDGLCCLMAVADLESSSRHR